MQSSLLVVILLFGCCVANLHISNVYQLQQKFKRMSIAQQLEDHKTVTAKAGVMQDDINRVEPDVQRNVTELITSKGFPCENHHVVTPDGFILNLQRIPHGRVHNSTSGRPVIFLQHGLLDSSATWVINSANQSLGFILAESGYDVWLGNVRGNKYSRQHVKLQPSDAEFWAWSWDEIVAYDLPAMINYVLKTTGQKKLSYIGHSQGSLIAFTGFARDLAIQDKIKVFIALGPVYTVSHVTGFLRLIIDVLPEAEFLVELFGVHEFLPSNSVIQLLAKTLCHDPISRYLCENFIFLITGFDYKQLNVSRLPVYFSHTPAGTSVQNVVHFAQMVQVKRCQAFDYGSPKLNFLHYNQSTPPVYDISNLSVPTYLFSGSNDWLSDPKDVNELVTLLKGRVHHEVLRGWEHLDFIWSYKAASTLYAKIMNILQRYL